MANKLLKRLKARIARNKLALEIDLLLDKMRAGDSSAEEIMRRRSEKNSEFRRVLDERISKRLSLGKYAHVEESQITQGMRPVRK